MERKWVPTIAELIDRLSIHQLKEVLMPENKSKYSSEMADIVHDIDVLIKQNDVKISGELIHVIIALAQINSHIWYNESKARRGEEQDLKLLQLTHGLNGIRSRLQNAILDISGNISRKDYKSDCLAADFKDWEMGVLKKKL